MSTPAHRYAQAMAVTEHARGRAEEERAWLDLLALLPAPAPAPSAATARHERAVAYADDVAEGGAPVPDDYERHYCTDDGEDWPCGAARAARVPEAAVEAGARAMQAENTPRPDPLNRDQREEQDDATIATYRTLTRAALAAALPLLTDPEGDPR